MIDIRRKLQAGVLHLRSLLVRKRQLATVLVILIASRGALCEGVIREIPPGDVTKMLEFLSSSVRSNFENIRTWAGTYKYEDIRNYNVKGAGQLAEALGLNASEVNGPVRARSSGTVEFATNIGNNQLYTSFINKGTQYDVGKSRRPLEIDAQEFIQESIVTPEHYLHFQPNVTWGRSRRSFGYGPSGKRAAFRDPVAKSEGQRWGCIVDPRSLFSGGRRRFWEELDLIAKSISKLGGEFVVGKYHMRLTETREGGQSRFSLSVPFKGPGGAVMFNEMTFDERCGLNVTSVAWVGESGQVRQKTEYEYVLKDGVYIPSRVRRIHFDEDGLRIKFERTLELVKSEVNGKIDEKVFTPIAFGLKEGERLIDNIEGVEYVIKDGKLEKARWNIESEFDVAAAMNRDIMQLPGDAPVEPEGQEGVTPSTVGKEVKRRNDLSRNRQVPKKGGLPWHMVVILLLGIGFGGAGVITIWWCVKKSRRVACKG